MTQADMERALEAHSAKEKRKQTARATLIVLGIAVVFGGVYLLTVLNTH